MHEDYGDGAPPDAMVDAANEAQDLRAQVARLEAEAAPLRAALVAWRSLLIVLDNQPRRNEIIELRAQTIDLLDHADAGRGWVSPEVKREVGLALAGIQTCQRCRACVNIATIALDALKGVE